MLGLYEYCLGTVIVEKLGFVYRESSQFLPADAPDVFSSIPWYHCLDHTQVDKAEEGR